MAFRGQHDFEITAHLAAVTERVADLLEERSVALEALREVERLRDALVVISGGICASAQDKHLDPPGSYCGGACYVCIARAALGKEGSDE